MRILCTLGTQRLHGPHGREASVILSQPKRFALLVYLALGCPGGFCRRDTLLSLFWPEMDTPHARNALSQSLSFLRRNLSKGVIVGRGAWEVGLAPGAIKVDVAEFNGLITESRWSDALDLYAGDFLTGFHLESARGFEEWMDGKRERLRERAAGAAWALARDHISRGGLVEAERSAKKALGFVWTEETPVREFIWALAEAGDRIAAINLFEMFCSRLRRDLDLAPSARTRQVAEQIRKEEVDWVLAS